MPGTAYSAQSSPVVTCVQCQLPSVTLLLAGVRAVWKAGGGGLPERDPVSRRTCHFRDSHPSVTAAAIVFRSGFAAVSPWNLDMRDCSSFTCAGSQQCCVCSDCRSCARMQQSQQAAMEPTPGPVSPAGLCKRGPGLAWLSGLVQWDATALCCAVLSACCLLPWFRPQQSCKVYSRLKS